MRAIQRSVVALTTLLLSAASVMAAAVPEANAAAPTGSVSVPVTAQTVDSRNASMDAVAIQYRLGGPVGPVVEGLKDNGAYRVYQRGVVVYSPATGAQVSYGAIRTVYAGRSFETGFLGYPTTGELRTAAGVTYQNYQGGTIAWTSVGGAHILFGPERDLWFSEVGNRVLGYPTSEGYGLLTTGGVVGQNFQGGLVVTWYGRISVLTPGAIRDKYFASGGFSSDIGLPVSLYETTGLTGGGAAQGFSNSWIVWSPATGAHVSKGAIREAWIKNGAESGVLNYPLTDEYRYSGDGAVAQDFVGGRIIWSARGGIIVNRK